MEMQWVQLSKYLGISKGVLVRMFVGDAMGTQHGLIRWGFCWKCQRRLVVGTAVSNAVGLIVEIESEFQRIILLDCLVGDVMGA